MNEDFPKPKRVIGLFTLAMISISAIIALRNLPMMAIQGWASLFFYGSAALFFFIPIALVCAELTSGWPELGGVYAWVREAFGEAAGFLSIWFEWIESVVWLPTVLSFVAASLAYLINPALADNRYFLLTVMLVVLWSGTFLNFLSIQTSSLVSSIGILFGSIIPGIAIIVLGLSWALTGHPLQIAFSVDALIPSMQFDNLVYFTGILLSFAGIEVAAYHVKDTKDPQRTFPKATFISACSIIIIYVLGALSIAFVVPKSAITLHAGLMQAFATFLEAFHLLWALPLLALLSVLGALALLNTWIIGPSKGLLASALNGDMPSITRKVNKNGSPIAILIMQAFIGSALSCVLLLMPTVSSSYWMLNVLASQLILMMYFLIFLAAIRLRYTQKNTYRAYKIPGGNLGMWIVAGIGALSCVVAFIIGFVPPAEFEFDRREMYPLILIVSLLLFSAPPFLCLYFNKRKKEKTRPV